MALCFKKASASRSFSSLKYNSAFMTKTLRIASLNSSLFSLMSLQYGGGSNLVFFPTCRCGSHLGVCQSAYPKAFHIFRTALIVLFKVPIVAHVYFSQINKSTKGFVIYLDGTRVVSSCLFKMLLVLLSMSIPSIPGFLGSIDSLNKW